jgi:hypothetical protein
MVEPGPERTEAVLVAVNGILDALEHAGKLADSY